MTMSTALLDATAQVQAGVKAIFARLESLEQTEHEAAARVDVLTQKEEQAKERLSERLLKLSNANAAVDAAEAAYVLAEKKADDYAVTVAAAAKEESKRLIDAANEKCAEVKEAREASRAEWVDFQGKADAARTELSALRTKIAQAKESFLKA